MEFSVILKELREERGLKQKELAAMSGLSAQCISTLEMGTRQPTGNTLLALANALNVSADFLLGRTDDIGEVMVPGTVLSLLKDEQELLARYRSLRSDVKEAFWISLRAMSSASAEDITSKKNT